MNDCPGANKQLAATYFNFDEPSEEKICAHLVRTLVPNENKHICHVGYAASLSSHKPVSLSLSIFMSLSYMHPDKRRMLYNCC